MLWYICSFSCATPCKLLVPHTVPCNGCRILLCSSISNKTLPCCVIFTKWILLTPNVHDMYMIWIRDLVMLLILGWVIKKVFFFLLFFSFFLFFSLSFSFLSFFSLLFFLFFLQYKIKWLLLVDKLCTISHCSTFSPHPHWAFSKWLVSLNRGKTPFVLAAWSVP